MDEDRNQEPGKRLRNILDSDEKELNPQPEPDLELQARDQHRPKPQTRVRSPLEQLPHLKPPAEASPPTETRTDAPKPKLPVVTNKLPKGKQPVLQKQTEAVDVQDIPRREKFWRALWKMTSLISMAVNIVVIIVLVIAFWAYRDIQLPEGVDITLVNKLLSGLYSNFELMDAAKISANIPVKDEIPVRFDLELKQPTTVTLSEDVTIRGANVIINTPVIDINAPAIVTLPAGTNLPIILDLVVPVDKQVPVDLNVAVDIPLNETELHTPFVGLQEVVKPLYCLVEPAAASSLTGSPICR